MKIVLDLQGAQSQSRHRGIGRYSLSMAKAFIAAAGNHDIWLALHGRDAAAMLELRAQFSGLLPSDQIIVYDLPPDIAGCIPGSRERSHMAEVIQTDFFDRLQPDLIWHSSLFEGWGDDSTASVGGNGHGDRHVATLYDLIPLMHPGRYLYDEAYRLWYYRRLALLKRCGLLLAISESSRREVMEQLHVPDERIAVVGAAADAVFQPIHAEAADWVRWQGQGISDGYILYAGGFDAHKNVDGLIAAYAELPSNLRERHVLVLAGRCDVLTMRTLKNHAKRQRLSESQVVFTGGIDDIELAKLYSNAQLFVSPSLHEGFGLPALEAMACGAAVIASDAASLPEVVGRRDALFRARSSSSMTASMQRALEEPGFLASLREHAPNQAKKFSWAACAARAWEAIERSAQRSATQKNRVRPKLVYVSPLPPARSGIADYSARLLRDLATHYDIAVVADQPEVVDTWALANFPVHKPAWLEGLNQDVRVLYHMGNSPLHEAMFGLMKARPGVVVLHDFYLGNVRDWIAQQRGDAGTFLSELYSSHGYQALYGDHVKGRASTLREYPVNLDIIGGALGVLVHSQHARDLAAQRYGAQAAARFEVVPFAKPVVAADRRAARRSLGLSDDDFIVCSFGFLAPTKLNERLLDAWLKSDLAADRACQLFFVGENHGGDYGASLEAKMRASPQRGRLHITGYVDAEHYALYLAAADLAVQLRTDTRGETSAAVFDVLAHGVPLIANAHGSIAELPPDVMCLLDDVFADGDLINALQSLRNNQGSRGALSTAAVEWLAAQHHPVTVAARYAQAIEAIYSRSPQSTSERLLQSLGAFESVAVSASPLKKEARGWMEGNRPHLSQRQLFVDVSATAVTHLHSGIERVVRGVLSELLKHGDASWRVEPVCLRDGVYVRAQDYALHLMECPPWPLGDLGIHPRKGDVFLGLDWVADKIPTYTSVLDGWRLRGVGVFFVVYDLLPVIRPEWFPADVGSMQARWLEVIAEHADGLIGISRAVVDDLRVWLSINGPVRDQPLKLGYFYPGSDLAATRPSRGLPPRGGHVVTGSGKRCMFLMVGTVEPRKGHAFVLDAFEQWWREGGKAALVVVGREGWMSEPVVRRLRELGRDPSKLIWLEQASDEYLEQLYQQANALIAASEAEGFGLPLVEAARRGLSVVARDIPVFREVAPFAQFFHGHQALLEVLKQQQATPSKASADLGAAVVTWQSTSATLQAMLNAPDHDQWLDTWFGSVA